MSASVRRVRFEPGQVVSARSLTTLNGPSALPNPGRLVHLQFRRFAGCPVCDMHLHAIARRHAEIVSAGIQEIAVFHSSDEELRPFTAELPFDVVADPRKALYKAFGVEASPRALLDPRAWLPIVRGVLRSAGRIVQRKQPVTSLNAEGGKLGLPADFLIDSDGKILACKYGTYIYDQWSVDELLAAARHAMRSR